MHLTLTWTDNCIYLYMNIAKSKFSLLLFVSFQRIRSNFRRTTIKYKIYFFAIEILKRKKVIISFFSTTHFLHFLHFCIFLLFLHIDDNSLYQLHCNEKEPESEKIIIFWSKTIKFYWIFVFLILF